MSFYQAEGKLKPKEHNVHAGRQNPVKKERKHNMRPLKMKPSDFNEHFSTIKHKDSLNKAACHKLKQSLVNTAICSALCQDINKNVLFKLR